MKFINGYPKIQGASDLEDSSHLAGILAITEHPTYVNCAIYVESYVEPEFDLMISSIPILHRKRRYVRCKNSKYDFSRDQFILLAAGLIKQGLYGLVDTYYIDGRDIMPPSVQGMVRIAQGKKPYWFQTLWFKSELWVNYTFQRIEEPFQIIAMCEVYGVEYLKLWTSKNNLWKWAIKRYLCELDGAWRGEPELAEHVIRYVESKIKA